MEIVSYFQFPQVKSEVFLVSIPCYRLPAAATTEGELHVETPGSLESTLLCFLF